jgi:DNA invertase Pin-like site-specific DNA recombinase
LQPGDSVIVAKLDRMFRSAIDALEVAGTMRANQINLHLIDLGGDVSGNGMAKTFFIIASAFAEAERDRIRERVTETKRDQRKRGKFLGGVVPYGWRAVPMEGEKGKKLEEIPEQ